jgi:hypothetical protein
MLPRLGLLVRVVRKEQFGKLKPGAGDLWAASQHSGRAYRLLVVGACFFRPTEQSHARYRYHPSERDSHYLFIKRLVFVLGEGEYNKVLTDFVEKKLRDNCFSRHAPRMFLMVSFSSRASADFIA